MSALDTVASQVREFIVANFLYGQERPFEDNSSFLGEGIIDSTGVLQLVTFLEETYGITVDDEELIPENLDSIDSVATYISRKTNPVAATAEPEHQSVLGGKA